MRTDNIVRIFAGFMVFVSSLLGYLYSPYWLFVTMFVGLNLLQYGFTNFCPLALIIDKIRD